MTPQDDDEQLPISRIDYALDEIGVYKWQDNYDEMADVLINDNCPGDILDWGEPIRDDRTATYDSTCNTTGCRGITCQECWEQEAYKEAANDQA